MGGAKGKRRERWRRRRKCFLDDVKKMGGSRTLKQETINWNLSRMHFGRGYRLL
jgi:hypothetical protein